MYGVMQAVVVFLGWVFVAAMAVRSVTLVREVPLYFEVLRRDLTVFGATWVTFRYMAAPALLASPGWIAVAGPSLFQVTPLGELEEMAEEVINMLEEE